MRASSDGQVDRLQGDLRRSEGRCAAV